MPREYDSKNFPIPEKLNIIILFLVFPVTWACLYVASHLSLLYALIAAVIFALIHNTLFSLLHEAVHGNFFNNKSLNKLFGNLTAMAFPTSFTMQQIAHLGHHKRNRTDKELYDYYLPHESKVLRNIWLYGGNLLGLYWFMIPLANLLVLVFPMLFKSQWFVHGPAKVLGFEAFMEEIAEHSISKIWLESMLALLYQIVIIILLDLSLAGWLLCHYLFSLHWSALQYVDHAWSPRDIINGAWNLKVLPISRLFSLNSHYHLAHHQNPTIPWIHLPKFVDSKEPQPTFWSIYFSLWGGVRPAPPMVGDDAN